MRIKNISGKIEIHEQYGFDTAMKAKQQEQHLVWTTKEKWNK